MYRPIVSLVLCAAVGLTGCMPSFNVPPFDPAAQDRRDQPVDPAVAQALQAALDRVTKVPGAAGVVVQVASPQRGNWTGAAGFADASRSLPMQSDYALRIGSVTKTFVAATALRLVQQGKLGLDDPIVRHLDASVTAKVPHADRITVRQLMNHAAGIYNYTDDPTVKAAMAQPRVWPWLDLLDIAAKYSATAEPGTGARYSNTGYLLLGAIVEQASGLPWAEAVEREVLQPLQLRATTYPATAELPDAEMRGYQRDGETLKDVTAVHPSLAGASGGLVSTAADTTRFFDALMDGELLDAAGMAALQTYVPISGGGGEYGLGLERFETPAGPIVGKNGAIIGFTAFVGRLENRTTLTILINSSSPKVPDVFSAIVPALYEPAAR